MQIALLVAAGVAFLAAFAFRSVKPDKIAPAWALFGLGIVLAAAALILPRLSTGEEVQISIVSPADGATVPAGEPVTIEVDVEGGEISASTSASGSGGHIHIFVDGSVAAMPTGPTGEVNLDPGEHELKVEYVDIQHASLDPPVQETITVTAERGSGQG